MPTNPLPAPHPEYDGMLASGYVRNDALEGIQSALEQLLAREAAAPPAIHLVAPAVTIPAANIHVAVPRPAQQWAVKITARDAAGRIQSFTMNATP